MQTGYYTSFDNTKIFYQIEGSLKNKKIMLLLHGLGGNVTAWQPYQSYFAKLGYTTVAFDLRGHGLSGRPKAKKSYALENFAKDIEVFIQENHLQHVVLVGQCIGGMIAMILVGKLKLQPASLILIGTGYTMPSYLSLIERPKALSFLYAALNKFPLPLGKPGHENLVKFRGTGTINLARFTSDVIHCTAQSYLGICSNLFSFNGFSLLQHITCPTLIIHGTKDIIFPQAAAKKLHGLIKNSQLVFIPKANHILVINNPEEIIRILNIYLLEKVKIIV